MSTITYIKKVLFYLVLFTFLLSLSGCEMIIESLIQSIISDLIQQIIPVGGIAFGIIGIVGFFFNYKRNPGMTLPFSSIGIIFYLISIICSVMSLRIWGKEDNPSVWILMTAVILLVIQLIMVIIALIILRQRKKDTD